MPICIECSYPVSHLYSTYSRADDRSLGKGVRLTQCPRCRRFADKYVEYDFVVLFIDLVLIKPQVYRHLLFNRLGRADNQFDPSIVRLGILLLLFDVYLTWARVENSPSHASSIICDAPIVVQYFFFLSLNALSTLAHHMTVRLLASILVPKSSSATTANSWTMNPNLGPANPGHNAKTSGGESAQHVTDTPGPSAPSTPMISCFPTSASAAQPPAPSSGTLSGPASPSQSMTPTQENVLAAVAAGNRRSAGASDSTFSSGHAEPLPSPSASLFPGTVSLDSHSSPPTPTGASGTTTAGTVASGATSPIPPPTPSHPSGPSRRPSGAPLQSLQPLPPPFPASPTAISTALLVSSCAKLFPILLVIWAPDGSGGTTSSSSSSVDASTATTQPLPSSSMTSPSSLIQRATIIAGTAAVRNGDGASASPSAHSGIPYLFSAIFNGLVSLLSLSAADTHLVLLNNIEALYILLGCGYTRAVALAVAGQVARWAVQRIVLSVVGIG